MAASNQNKNIFMINAIEKVLSLLEDGEIKIFC